MGPLLPGYPSLDQWEEDPVDAAQIVLERLDRVGAGGILGEAAVWGAGEFGAAGVREFSVGSRVFALNSISNFTKTIRNWAKQGGPFGGATTWQTVGRPLTQSLGGSGFLQTAQIANNLIGKMLDESPPPPPRQPGDPAPAVNVKDYWVNHRIGITNYIRAAGRELNLDVRQRGTTYGRPSKKKAHVGEMVLATYAGDFDWFHRSKAAAEAAIVEEGILGKDIQKNLLETFVGFHPLKSPFKTSVSYDEYQKILDVVGEASGEDAREGVRRGVDKFNEALTWLYGEPYEGKVEVEPTPERFRPTPRKPQKPSRSPQLTPPGDYRSRAATMNP